MAGKGWTISWQHISHAYQDCDDEVKDVPAILPESPEVIEPLKDDLQDKDEQSTVVKDVQHGLQSLQIGVTTVGNL